MSKSSNQYYSKEEAQQRFEQALRGARIAGHKPMSDVLSKRPKKQRKAKRGTNKS